MKITAVELSDSEIDDIFARASKACAYWADKTNWISDHNFICTKLKFHHENGQSVLDTEAVKRGVCLALTHTHHVSKQLGGINPTTENMDMIAIDMIVQYGLFGKLVYG